MSMRLSDSDKWKNPWFRNLPGKIKLFFIYAIDVADDSGVMHLDMPLISFTLKEEIQIEDIKKYLSAQLIFLSEDKVIIKNFVRHQRNKDNPTMEKNIKKLLEKHGIYDRYLRGEFG